MLEQERPYCECPEITKSQRQVRKGKQEWDSLTKETKVAVRVQLAAAQEGFCVYCERPLAKDGQQIPQGHVEHIKPRSKYSELTFDHKNLAASCNGYVAGKGLVSCGHKKGKHELPVEPGPGCNDGLVLLDDGTLDPGGSDDLAQTLEILGLNAPAQVAFRKGLISQARNLAKGGQAYEDVLGAFAPVGGHNYLRIYLDDLPPR